MFTPILQDGVGLLQGKRQLQNISGSFKISVGLSQLI